VKQALATQKRPLVLGLFFTLLVSAITFGADYMDARRQQAINAQEQAAALVTRINVVNGELRAAGAFLEEANRALFRFDDYIRRLSGTEIDQTNWAVVATADPEKIVQFNNWQKVQIKAVENRDIQPSSTNVVILAAGSQNVLLPGSSINLPNNIADSKGPIPVSSGELKLDGPPDALWLILSSQPAEVQIMNGVKTLITLRQVDLGRLRTFAGLSPLQKLKIEWSAAIGGGQPQQLGATDIDEANRTFKLMNVGDFKLGFAIDNPPLPRLPRTWLLMFLVGTASTAFWVAWRAAGTLNVRAGALAKAVDQTSGKLRVIHEKERTFFENAGTPQCEVDPPTGRFLRVNKALCDWLGYDSAELLAKTAYEISAPEDVAISHLHVEKARLSPDNLLQLEKRYVKKDGAIVWGLVTSNLFSDPISGDKVFLTTIIDITVRKEADAVRDRLLRELAHRVRNTMQLTDSLARQSAVGTQSAQAYAKDFRSRLSALSRAQDVLFETNWVSADMRELAVRIVKPFDNGKIKIDLPVVELPPQHAQTFALALHELISHSAERGAVKSGKPVELTGELDGVDEFGKRNLTLTWKETFPNQARKVGSKNFGHSMLQVALPRQFDGEAESSHTSRGFTYVARLTLPEK
jgi:PAS domain S-box-containing protein